MALIEWSDETFNVGVKTIDEQHKNLVQYINDLAEAIEKKQTENKITIIFNRLYEYTKYHFKEEEQYFSRLNEADTKLHQLQHKHFIEQLDIIAKKQDGDAEIISAELLFFLTDWIVIHIQCEDRKLSQPKVD